jgi:ferredoxin
MDNSTNGYHVNSRECVGCQTCLDHAPFNFSFENNQFQAFVSKQPETEKEIKECKTAMEECPSWAIINYLPVKWVSPKEKKINTLGWQVQIIAPELFCLNDAWDFDTNVLIIMVNQSGAVVPDFKGTSSFWVHRKANILNFLRSNSFHNNGLDIEINFSTEDIDFYPYLKKEYKATSIYDTDYQKINNIYLINEFRSIGAITREHAPTVKSNILWLNSSVGIAVFGGVISPKYKTKVSKGHSGQSLEDIAVNITISVATFNLFNENYHFKVDYHSNDTTVAVGGQLNKTIFASHAPQDIGIIRSLDSILAGLNLGELRYKTKFMKAGDQFSKVHIEIENSDSFQLFWSNHAKSDQDVLNELKHALSLSRSGFIKPVYWEEPMPDVPPEISLFWVSRLDLIQIDKGKESVINYHIDKVETFNQTNQHMRDQYNVNQAAAVGPNSVVHSSAINQVNYNIPADLDYSKLSEELFQLRKALTAKAVSSDHYNALGKVADAEEAAKAKDGSKVLEFLKEAGKWVMDGVKDISTDVLSDLIKKQIGLT